MILAPSFTNILNKTLYLLLILLVGLIIGIFIVMLFYLVISLIDKRVRKKPKDLSNVVTPITDPSKVIGKYLTIYNMEYANKIMSKRIASVKEIGFDLIKDMATIYYPNSPNPLLEVSIENLYILANHILDNIDSLVNDIIENNAFKIVWFGYASIHNVSNFIKGILKKEKSENLSLNVRNLKLTYILDVLDKKSKPEKKDKEYQNYFLLDTFINNKIKELINYVGSWASLVYSNSINNLKGGNNL